MRKAFALAAILACAAGAHADSVPATGSAQVVGLFWQACLSHPLDAQATRAFLDSKHLPQMTAASTAVFLQSRPGVVYNASAQGIRLALGSEDSGACTAFTDHAATSDVENDLEAQWHAVGTPFFVAHDGADPQHPTTHLRSYHVKLDGKVALILISIDEASPSLQAILTLAPWAAADALPEDGALTK